ENIDQESYLKLKERLDMELIEINATLNERSDYDENAEKFVNFGLNLLSNIDLLYTKASVNIKKHLLGSIFSEKLVFEKNKYRTTKFNPAIALLANTYRGSTLSKKKNGDTF